MICNFTRCIDPRGMDYLEGIFNEISSAMGCSNPIEAIDLFEKMMTEMNMHNPVAGERDAELTALSTSVNPVRLKNNPTGINEEEALMLYNVIIH